MAPREKRIPPEGFFTLEEKTIPVVERQPPASPSDPFCKTRGHVEMKGWNTALAAITNENWEDIARKHNVPIVRPAHDQWGIAKIIFTFCDDFLTNIIDLPLARSPVWEPLLNEVYTTIGVKPERVVRALLARMPPGVSIPPHHDTGLWVKHTHRVHMALETDPEIYFMAGPNEQDMEPYLFDTGRIVELNNQAKHAVVNEMKQGYRTHLIFDYVDEDYVLPRRVQMAVGESVYQTRRSIDIGSDVKNYDYLECSPRFIVIGAQKAGTTSMYEHIHEHPLVLRGKTREPHYFDWSFNKNIPEDDVRGHRDYYMNYFEKKFLATRPSLICGESTPSYMLYSHLVLPRLLKYCPWTKLIVMLRNPVSRAFSQYQMVIDSKGTPQQLRLRGQSAMFGKSFEQVIDEEMEYLQKKGVHPDMSYEDLKENILKEVPMNHGGHSLLLRGLYHLLLLPFFEQWPASQMKIMSTKDIAGSPEKVRAKMSEVFEYLDLPPTDIADVEAKNTRSYDPINPETREKLEAFFRPYNEKLFDHLGYTPDW